MLILPATTCGRVLIVSKSHIALSALKHELNCYKMFFGRLDRETQTLVSNDSFRCFD